jgi:hypothetical protein
MKGAFEATFNGQNKDGEKSKSIRKCLCGELHKFIDCPYLFAEVKEALAKAHNGIKAALERAKAKLEKQDSTSTLTPGSPATTNKLGNFAA